MEATIITRTFAACPICGEASFAICHKSGQYGPWGCDNCGARFRFDIREDGVGMIQEPVSDIPAWLVVKISGADGPVYFVIDSPIYAHGQDDPPAEQFGNDEYYVEESTCPTNLIPVEAIVTDGDADPHGILEFVGRVTKELGETSDDDNFEPDWNAIIARALAQNAEFNAATLPPRGGLG